MCIGLRRHGTQVVMHVIADRSDVSTVEVLTRTYDLAAQAPPNSHAMMDVSSIAAKLRDHERRKEERRVIQMKNAREKARLAKEKAEREAAAAAAASKPAEEIEERVNVEISEEEAVNAELTPSPDAPPAGAEKRKEHEASEDGEGAPAKKPKYAENDAAGEASEPDLAAGTEKETSGPAKPFEEPEIAWSSMTLTKPSPEMRGHTSYLTFATLYPAAIREEMTAA